MPLLSTTTDNRSPPKALSSFVVTLFREVPKVDAGLAASIFHFGEVTIPALKDMLAQNGINVRRI